MRWRGQKVDPQQRWATEVAQRRRSSGHHRYLDTHHFSFNTTHLMENYYYPPTSSMWTSPLNWGGVSWKSHESHLGFRKPCEQTTHRCLSHFYLCICTFEFKPKCFLQPEATAREEGGSGGAVGAWTGGGGRFFRLLSWENKSVKVVYYIILVLLPHRNTNRGKVVSSPKAQANLKHISALVV